MNKMTRGELLLVLYSMKELLENGLIDSAIKVLDKAIKQLESDNKKNN